MSNDTAIFLQNISKVYKRYHRPVDRLKEILLPGKPRAEEFWALRDVSLDVTCGETIGIIGRNGSGKSTLLQIIVGTLQPTSGVVQVKGRVSALLELGSGFNPEFTGRQNVFFNGRILGLSQAEIEDRFDQIAAFADIGEFLDQPVKTYSSGMFVRLAFAVAVYVEPEILVVDEALAVGDLYFQAKAMARIRQLMEAGITTLFVSHDLGSVKALCQRCIYMEHGVTKQVGDVAQVVSTYMSDIHTQMNADLRQNSLEFAGKTEPLSELEPTQTASENSPTLSRDETAFSNLTVSTTASMISSKMLNRYGDGSAEVLDVKLLDRNREVTDHLECHEPFVIQASVLIKQPLETFCIGYSMRDLKGQMLTSLVSTRETINIPAGNPGDTYVFEIAGKTPLNVGNYTLTVAIEYPVVENIQHVFVDILENVLLFQVYLPKNPLKRFPSLVYAPVNFYCRKLTSAPDGL
ncbi:MAG TPA: ABC transporter ATP-binding protein [Leptolyngbyaceae cyanobacterium]